MKELSIQEKAEAYDKAYKLAEGIHRFSSNPSEIKRMEEIFPALKEWDERIRYALISQFKDYQRRGENHGFGYSNEEILAWLEKQGEERKITHEEICKSYGIPDIGEFSDGYHTFNGLYKQRMILFAVLVNTYKDRAWKSWKHEDGLDCFGGGWFIVGIDTPAGSYTYHYEAQDWDKFDCQVLDKAKHWDGRDESDVDRLFSLLEKQGEQKPADKVEPQFKIGDLVVDNCGYVWRIEGIINQFYALEGIDGGESRPTIEWVNKTFHLWSIQDAKEGDVLVASDGSIFLFKDAVGGACRHYAALTTDNVIKVNEGLKHYWELSIAVHPATKEQRDLLFQKMEEAGYEWDDVNKEVK